MTTAQSKQLPGVQEVVGERRVVRVIGPIAWFQNGQPNHGEVCPSHGNDPKVRTQTHSSWRSSCSVEVFSTQDDVIFRLQPVMYTGLAQYYHTQLMAVRE